MSGRNKNAIMEKAARMEIPIQIIFNFLLCFSI